jgi:hypothetical protein
VSPAAKFAFEAIQARRREKNFVPPGKKIRGRVKINYRTCLNFCRLRPEKHAGRDHAA